MGWLLVCQRNSETMFIPMVTVEDLEDASFFEQDSDYCCFNSNLFEVIRTSLLYRAGMLAE